jgi:hypothetical protein
LAHPVRSGLAAACGFAGASCFGAGDGFRALAGFAAIAGFAAATGFAAGAVAETGSAGVAGAAELFAGAVDAQTGFAAFTAGCGGGCRFAEGGEGGWDNERKHGAKNSKDFHGNSPFGTV